MPLGRFHPDRLQTREFVGAGRLIYLCLPWSHKIGLTTFRESFFAASQSDYHSPSHVGVTLLLHFSRFASLIRFSSSIPLCNAYMVMNVSILVVLRRGVLSLPRSRF